MDITKRDVALHQVATAIWLYFEDVDPISVHTLASAASEVLDGLVKQAGGDTERARTLDMIHEDRRQEVGRLLNKARNFFKHGSQPEEVLKEFDDEWNLYPLWVCCSGLRRLYGFDTPPEVGVFEAWLSIVEPELMSVPATREASAAFGDSLRGLPRGEQKVVGRDALRAISEARPR